MAHPETTTRRGFDSAGEPLPAGEAAFDLARRGDGRPSMQDWPDFSTRVLMLNEGSRLPAVASSLLKESVDLGDVDRWDSLTWDPEVGLLVIIPDTDIMISTDPEGPVDDDDFGVPIDAGVAFPLHVAGAPQGQLWVRRRGADANNVIRAYGYGSSSMVFSTRNAYGVSHDA